MRKKGFKNSCPFRVKFDDGGPSSGSTTIALHGTLSVDIVVTYDSHTIFELLYLK